jgi:hypothetical protein
VRRIDQVQRLCGIDRSMCKVALDALVETKFLCVRSDGSYVRIADATVPRQRASLTDLHSKT